MQPNLWYNPHSNVVYMWGGLPQNLSYSSTLWSFTPFSNGSIEWEETPSPSTNGLGEDAIVPFGGASVASNTTFYNLGGAIESENLPVQGLIEYDFASG